MLIVNCGGFAAGVAHRDVDVVGPDLLGDHVERLLRHLAGQLVVGPLRRPHAELELAGVDPREELAAQLAAHDDHDGAGRDQVGQHDHAPVRDRPAPSRTGLDPDDPWVGCRSSGVFEQIVKVNRHPAQIHLTR